MNSSTVTFPFGGYQCASCQVWVPYGQFHSCSGFYKPYDVPDTIPVPDNSVPLQKNWKYCPHCGEELD